MTDNFKWQGRIPGSLMGLKVDGQYVPCEVSSSFEYTYELKPKSSTESGIAREFKYGKLEWQMSVNANFLAREVGNDFKYILRGVLTRKIFDVEFSTKFGDPAAFAIKGKALTMNGGINAQRGQTSQWNVTFKGTGLFELVENPYFLIINAMPANADKPIYVNTTQW